MTGPEDDVPGLATLSPGSVARLIEVGRLVHIPQGWAPIRAQEPSDEAYLLLEGSVDVDLDGAVVAHLRRGEFVGEMGLVDRSLRSARVVVAEPVLAIAWPREDFQRLRRELADFDELVSSTAHARREQNERR